MSNIKFVSHETFPEDQYIKELVYLCLDEKYRVAYVRKQAKNGGIFWSVPSIGITKNGVKSYHECFMSWIDTGKISTKIFPAKIIFLISAYKIL